MLDRAVLDLSHWNEDVDFQEIAGADVVGIIHKATEGSSYVDDTYAGRKEPALEAGLLWGAYHFMRPGDQDAHAEHFIRTVGVSAHMLYCADYEDPEISLDQLKVFLTAVWEMTGRPPVLYSGHVLKEKLSGPDQELAHYPLWIAHYTGNAQPVWPTETWPQWWLWQHTEDGSCPGVAGDVDVNRYDGTAQQLVDEWAGWPHHMRRPIA